jgi:hypothetical protein
LAVNDIEVTSFYLEEIITNCAFCARVMRKRQISIITILKVKLKLEKFYCPIELSKLVIELLQRIIELVLLGVMKELSYLRVCLEWFLRKAIILEWLR